jgi:hypothetical protein
MEVIANQDQNPLEKPSQTPKNSADIENANDYLRPVNRALLQIMQI